jgi:hypothetical protein
LLVGHRGAREAVYAPVNDREPAVFLPMLDLSIGEIDGP